jgi:hypothetical protein
MNDHKPKMTPRRPSKRPDGTRLSYGLMVAAALGSVVAIVAVLIGSGGDARDTARAHTTIPTVERGARR